MYFYVQSIGESTGNYFTIGDEYTSLEEAQRFIDAMCQSNEMDEFDEYRIVMYYTPLSPSKAHRLVN